MRRALRIFPAYLVFLIGVAVLYSMGILSSAKPRWQDYLPAALYISDYVSVAWPLAHTWSLSVEEQFYFLWPAALLFSARKNKGLIPLAVICLAPLFRFAAFFGVTIFGDNQFESVADALAVGCLLAIYKDRVHSAILRRIPDGLTPFVLPVAGLSILLINVTANHPRILAPLAISLMNVVIGIAILFTLERPPTWLANRAIVWLGRVSYSLYLWQQPLFQEYRLRYWWVVISLVCAYLSFRLIEQPVLSWRDARPWGRQPRLAPENRP
jgi:peptidoglycan/LPS O-acetylase OafA/YrhL